MFSIILFTSCEDSYKIVQEGELNDSNVISNPSDMQKYLNGIYANETISSEIAFTSIFTDETGIGKSSGGQNFDTHRFQLNSGNGFASGIWYGHYTVINRVNRFLDAVSKLTPPTDPAELESFNSMIAQAKVLRAFSNFQLLSYFSTDLTNDNALGIIKLDYVPDFNEHLLRVSNGEIFSFIDSDLAYADSNLVDQTSSSYKFVSKNMVNALRARMYLYRGKYTLAKQYALDAIANGPALASATPFPTGTIGSSTWNNSFYGSTSTNPYRKMFADAAQGEIIFSLDRPGAGTWENISSNFNTNTSTAGGSPLFEVGRTLFNLLNANSKDVRRYANVDPTSTPSPTYSTDADPFSSDVLIIDKYPGKTGAVLRNDLKVFRVSEMYFILAECYAHDNTINGSSNSVASVLKTIRDARFFNSAPALAVYSSQQDAYRDILTERFKELSFEGHRYIDLKRLGALANKSIERDNVDDKLSGMPLTIPIGDYRFTMPIPADELNANPNIQQNPGY